MSSFDQENALTDPNAFALIEAHQREHRKAVQARYDQLPDCNPPTRANTVVTMPSHDYRMDIETHKGLLSSFQHFGGELTLNGFSDVGQARNKIFNAVLATPFEWMVCIDSDIGFSCTDLEKLLFLASPIDYAVNGVYAKKDDKDEAVTQGLGFARIHRSVLEAIKLHMPLPYRDEMANGEWMDCQDFCITGSTKNMGMLREDSGFWFMCSEIGVIPRLERSVNLRHYGGRRGYELSSLHRLQT